MSKIVQPDDSVSPETHGKNDSTATSSEPVPQVIVDSQSIRSASGFGRIPVTNVSPVVEMGVYPAKAVVNELIPITANIFREGHDAVGASVILIHPDGSESSTRMTQIEPIGLDIWQAFVRPDAEGDWSFRIDSWSDSWNTFRHNAEAKLSAKYDIELVCAEAHMLFSRSATCARENGQMLDADVLDSAANMMDPNKGYVALRDIVMSKPLNRIMTKHYPRELVTTGKKYPLRVERKRALFSSWYEFFPRSQGAKYHEDSKTWTSGTFLSSYERLEAAASMGFDIVYLPPIHPIGKSFRKGKNNSLTATSNDPGSPWAIGSIEGGHDAIHPELGTLNDFDRFVAKAKSLGLEVALDFALQVSPDHPWVSQHPEWFTKRADNTIAYAENPPKKYQDIYPLNFDNDPEGLYLECLRILKFWISHGVTVFRVDNPHTKPIIFWSWLLSEIHKTNPEVIFMAEAFTRPEMMHALGKVGFQMSYTYFTWRNQKWELEEYLAELSKKTAHFFRPNFFVNTPDINPFFLQSGNPSSFAIRAILAATLSPSWGIYSGFELCEHAAFKIGGEEYLNSEKYEYRPRDFSTQPNINLLIGKLNEIRNQHPSLQQLRNIHFHHAPHNDVIAFSKLDQDDLIIVVCSLNPNEAVDSEIYLDYDALAKENGSILQVKDELTGKEFVWGARNFVHLYPSQPAHILRVK